MDNAGIDFSNSRDRCDAFCSMATILKEGNHPLCTVFCDRSCLVYWELFTLSSACSGRRSLALASRGDFMVPHARSATRQRRAFSIVGPSFWNSLPSDLRSLPRDLSESFL